MGTRKRPSLEEAGKLLYYLIHTGANSIAWDEDTDKRKYIKLAIEIWRTVEASI